MASKRKENEQSALFTPEKKRKSETSELLTPMNVLLKMVVLDDEDFTTAARDLFKKKFSQDLIDVTTVKSVPLSRTPTNDSLKVLNYFGDQIKKLRVKYESSYRRDEKTLDNAIIDKCYKSLEKIRFINAERFTMIDVIKSFENVQSVTFINGSLCEIIQNFGQIFPNANALKFDEVEVQRVKAK